MANILSAMNAHIQKELAPACAQLGDVDMEDPDRVTLEPLPLGLIHCPAGGNPCQEGERCPAAGDTYHIKCGSIGCKA